MIRIIIFILLHLFVFTWLRSWMFFDIAITTADFPTAYKSFKENYFCIKLNRRVEEDETIKKIVRSSDFAWRFWRRQEFQAKVESDSYWTGSASWNDKKLENELDLNPTIMNFCLQSQMTGSIKFYGPSENGWNTPKYFLF